MTVKGGARQETIFDSIRLLKEKGLTEKEAIAEVEGILRCQLPENILILIHEEWER